MKGRTARTGASAAGQFVDPTVRERALARSGGSCSRRWAHSGPIWRNRGDQNGTVGRRPVSATNRRCSTNEVVVRRVAQGRAERRPDPFNRRRVEVALTYNANALLAQYRRLRRPSITVLADAYSDEELATLVRLLEKLTLRLGSSGALNQPAAAVAAATRMSSPGSGSGPRARG